MIKKILFIFLGLLAAIAIVVALGGIKFFQVRKAMAEHARDMSTRERRAPNTRALRRPLRR